jgi:hypothetical protein
MPGSPLTAAELRWQRRDGVAGGDPQTTALRNSVDHRERSAEPFSGSADQQILHGR